jgi:hypothetical protein
VSQRQGSRDAGLDAALALLDPHDLGAEQPGLVAQETVLDFGALPAAGTIRDLVLVNVGRRYAQGRVQLPAWVTTAQVSVALTPGQQINLALKADARRAPAAGTLRGAVQVQDAAGSLVELEVRADISRLRFFRLHHPAWWANLMLVLFLALVVSGYTGYREFYNARHYQAGVAALQRGEWALARDEAYWLLDAPGDHHAAQALLAESYYWEGVEALRRGEWTAARSSLLKLYAVNPGFRDGTLLLKESSYQAGAAALEQGQWATAREELNRVKGYRDADALIEKSYKEAR